MAEALMRHKVENAGLADKIVIDSAGLGAWHVRAGNCGPACSGGTLAGSCADNWLGHWRRGLFSLPPRAAAGAAAQRVRLVQRHWRLELAQRKTFNVIQLPELVLSVANQHNVRKKQNLSPRTSNCQNVKFPI